MLLLFFPPKYRNQHMDLHSTHRRQRGSTVFFYLDQRCCGTHFSRSIAKGQGRLTKGRAFSRMKTLCVFTGMRRRATRVAWTVSYVGVC